MNEASALPVHSGRRLVFPGGQQVELEDFALPDLQDGEVLVETRFSLMSTGTENIVFNRLFDPGTHWDHWIKYPFYPGYCAVGTVVASRCDGLKIGTRVASRAKHHSHFIKPGADCFPIPDDLPFESALWFALAKIAWHGARAANHGLGDNVLIIGAGPIGQMSIRWASAAGAYPILVVDPSAERSTLAKAGGASAVISLPLSDAEPAILEANSGRLPGVVIDTTGNSKVFASALKMVAERGKVIVLGDTGRPGEQALTSDFIIRGITIQGVHDCHNSAQWNSATLSQLFFELARAGRFSTAGLNTHLFAPSNCKDAYELANRDRLKTMGIVFDWMAA